MPIGDVKLSTCQTFSTKTILGAINLGRILVQVDFQLNWSSFGIEAKLILCMQGLRKSQITELSFFSHFICLRRASLNTTQQQIRFLNSKYNIGKIHNLYHSQFT